MKIAGCFLIFLFFLSCTQAQLGVRYDPSMQTQKNLQYFKPKGNLFVGDCMPFFRDGTFYFYWLLDSAHHRGLNGLGGHQWVLSTTRDLLSWKQYPIVLGIDEGWEKSICTGSVVFYKGRYYAFYATRLLENGKVNEQLSYAISTDGIHFDKQKPNPFYTSAPGYSKRNFRDPKVFIGQDGLFHLFVSSQQENPVMASADGTLVHLTSSDLEHWAVLDPVLTGQASVPECPDYFRWKGWYYLVYSDRSNTYYVKSKGPYGPWEAPRYQALSEEFANVVKTGAFSKDRRIAAAWIPSREDSLDDHDEIFGGNAVFRELGQEPDGTLSARFPEEMIPPTGPRLQASVFNDYLSRSLDTAGVEIAAFNGVGAAHVENMPLNYRITMDMEPAGPNEEYGLLLRSSPKGQGGYRMNVEASAMRVSLGNTAILGVEGLTKPVKIDLIVTGDIMDVCIGGKRTLVNRGYEQKGNCLWFYAKHGKVRFTHIVIRPLLEPAD